MDQATQRCLKRHLVAALPLIHRMASRIGIKELLNLHLNAHGNVQIPMVDTLT